MKKLIHFFIRKHSPKLEDCSSFQINKEESDALYGGFKEYKPPIYEQDEHSNCSFKTSDLLVDIHQTK